jgi:hypothetical protein
MESAEEIRMNIKLLLEFCLRRENIQLRKQNIDEYKQKCMQIFTDVHQKYPTLFFTIIENPTSFPMQRLEELLQYKKKIEQDETKTEEVNHELGQKYYDEFVKHKLDKK